MKYMGYSWSCSVQGHLVYLAGLRAKQTQIWDSGILAGHIWGIVCNFSVKYHLGSFGELVTKWHVATKCLSLDRNGLKFGDSGELVGHLFDYGYLWPPSVLKVIWCTCLKIFSSSKTPFHRAKQIEIYDPKGS